MGSLRFAKALLTLFYTVMMVAFSSLQLMGLSQASSLPNADTSQNVHYFFYQNSEYPKDCSDVQRHCFQENSSGVYLIKPVGFQEPFEVFCHNEIDNGGWTVIQRREEGFINFNRTWSDYKDGFGFLSTEFFIGNEKLSYLTNQAVYELIIEAELSNSSSFYTSYKGFRIADEFGQYQLQRVHSFDSNGSVVLSECSPNEYFNDDCTMRCACNNIGLNRGLQCNAVSCDANAQCTNTNGVRNCSCNEGFMGDGITCIATPTTSSTTTPMYTDCKDVFDDGKTEDDVYKILPMGWPGEPFDVFCKMDNGGGWTVFQRRQDDRTSFYQNWISYRNGFGELRENFWLGNEQLFYLTNQKNYELRLDIITSDGTPLNSVFAEFQIQSEMNEYTMNKLGTRTSDSGFAGWDLGSNRGRPFSTYDRDNIACIHFNCAEKHKSGWWHHAFNCAPCSRCDECWCFVYNGGCTSACTGENLNGVYNGIDGEKISSWDGGYCDPQFVEMKIRPT